MNMALAALVAILGIALLVSLLSPLMRIGGMHTITVTASGSASGVPADVQVFIYANGTGTSSSSAAANLSTTLNALNSTLMNYVNWNRSNISTDSYTLTKALTKVNSTRMPYIAEESLHATVVTQRISALLGALSNISNVYVSSEYTMLSASQSSSLRSTALSSAIANATAQAHAVVGQNAVLAPINITVDTYRAYPVFGMASAPSAQGNNIAFYPGTAEATGTVSVTFSYRS
jgi:uncharacterized protein YggE